MCLVVGCMCPAHDGQGIVMFFMFLSATIGRGVHSVAMIAYLVIREQMM